MAGPQFPYWMMAQLGAAGQRTSDANDVLGQASQGMQGMYNQYAPGAMQNASNVGGWTQGVGQDLAGAYGGLQQGANQVMQTGMDPQSALYNRTAQQLQDQTRAAQSARGIGMSPYGAGVEGNVMSNFNIDWQNQQLQRQLAALQGAGGAMGQYGAGVAGGAGLAMQGAQLPISSMSGLFGAQNQAVAPQEAMIQNQMQQQQMQQQLMMQLFGAQQGQYNQGQQQQSQNLSGLGSLLGTGLGLFL